MKTIEDLRQQLLEISQKLEQLSQTPAFEELNQHSQHHCDVTLADAWHGIDCAIALLEQQYSPLTTDRN
ncbi:MAG: hypothetical protein AAF349_06715 [Cyanobacteria bacterium P01_A01_bin.68]